jgi:hypothetical protein
MSQFERGGRSVARPATPKPGSPSPAQHMCTGLSEEVGGIGEERREGLAGCTAQARGNSDNHGAIAMRIAMRTDQCLEMIISGLAYLAWTHRWGKLAHLSSSQVRHHCSMFVRCGDHRAALTEPCRVHRRGGLGKLFPPAQEANTALQVVTVCTGTFLVPRYALICRSTTTSYRALRIDLPSMVSRHALFDTRNWAAAALARDAPALRLARVRTQLSRARSAPSHNPPTVSCRIPSQWSVFAPPKNPQREWRGSRCSRRCRRW